MPTIELTSPSASAAPATGGVAGAAGAQTVSAYTATPGDGAGDPPAVRGGIVLIEEIWGVNEHITDVADRFAAEGYVVIAPEILALGVDLDEAAEIGWIRAHGTDQERHDSQPRFRDLLAPTRSPEYAAAALSALRSAVDWLLTDPRVDGRVGVVGFCFGGTYSLALASGDERVRATVSYYGAPLDADALRSVHGPVLAFFGAEDEHVLASRADTARALEAAGVPFDSVVYPDAGHAFFNDTNPLAYRPGPAADSWRRTLDFLADTLSGGR